MTYILEDSLTKNKQKKRCVPFTPIGAKSEELESQTKDTMRELEVLWTADVKRFQ